ncbi:MAG: hypothetical protein RL692_1139, partial [Planctomycetota bacterium]
MLCQVDLDNVAYAQSSVAPPQVLHIYWLAGQSNMEGHGVVDLDGADGYN